MKTTISMLRGTDGEIARPKMSVSDIGDDCMSWAKSIEMQTWHISRNYQLQAHCIKKSSNIVFYMFYKGYYQTSFLKSSSWSKQI